MQNLQKLNSTGEAIETKRLSRKERRQQFWGPIQRKLKARLEQSNGQETSGETSAGRSPLLRSTGESFRTARRTPAQRPRYDPGVVYRTGQAQHLRAPVSGPPHAFLYNLRGPTTHQWHPSDTGTLVGSDADVDEYKDAFVVGMALDPPAADDGGGLPEGKEHTGDLELEDYNDDVPSTRLLSLEAASASWPESSSSSKATNLQSTQATSTQDADESERPSTVTLYNYSKPIESIIEEQNEDLESVFSLPEDDAMSDAGSLPGLRKFQNAAARHIVKRFVEDEDLLALYQVAIQTMDRNRFARNHVRLLYSFSKELMSRGRTASERAAIQFLRRRSWRRLISFEIYELLRPDDVTMREKLQFRLNEEKSGAFLLARWLDEGDKVEEGKAQFTAANPRHQTGGSDSDFGDLEGDVSSESDDESAEENEEVLSKLESTGDFLVSGQPYETYKQDLRSFLGIPTSAEFKAKLESLPYVPRLPFVIEDLDEQEEDGTTLIGSEDMDLEPRKASGQEEEADPVENKLAPHLKFHFFPKLPPIVTRLLEFAPLHLLEPPVPEGKTRARWTCVSN